MSPVRAVVVGALAIALACGLYVGGVWLHLYGEHEGPGSPRGPEVSGDVIAVRQQSQSKAAVRLSGRHGRPEPKQILFGDLHVHTTFSTDAFLWSLPMMQGSGAHPLADACDYARFCSGLDFWSINDHAEASTPQRWSETIAAVRQCNAIAGDRHNPDVSVFLGWEWSQVGRDASDHYGHKNVILRGLDDNEITSRAIGAAGIATQGLRGSVGRMSPIVPLIEFGDRQRYFNFMHFMDEVNGVPHCPEGVPSPDLPKDCYESAATPRELFDKLDEWGVEAMVIPHGTTWGYYTPPGATLDKQLAAAQNDPQRQFLFEVMSGHGNSEEYRDWRAARFDEEGRAHCPEPTPDYLPSCWRAGQIIENRCLNAGIAAEECAARAQEARDIHIFGSAAGHLAVPGVQFEDWLDSGQCKDCFIPSFNYRPGGSAQYALSIANFDTPGDPRRFRFGFIASSDNHRARPGTGYKEFDRQDNTEANGASTPGWRRRMNRHMGEPQPKARLDDEEDVIALGFRALEFERQASFFMTGGLAAVHANGRSRDAIWDGLARKEVYGTSGDRILLWFDLVNAPGGARRLPMGSQTVMSESPRFEVRAVGAFKQAPGCPEHATGALDGEHLEKLCRGECYNPSDQRKLITRIEVVRIRPQRHKGESVAPLIEDPWKVIPCEPDQAGCVAVFEDDEYVEAGRDSVYYVRAIEEPSLAVNGGLLRCEYDDSGRCEKLSPCYGDYRTDDDDDCLAEIEERAWSSPIFVDAR